MTQVQTKEAKQEVEISVKQLEKQGLVLPKNITDTVFNTLSVYQSQGTVSFPQNYSVGNALKAAYLIYQNDPKLQKCTNASVANALLDMCIGGLNPSKNQCYFVPMGDQCTLMTSYFGKQTMVKRIKGVKDVRSDVIYKDTGYELNLDEYGNDDIKITVPCPLDKRKSENIIGAWAKVILDPEVWGVDTYTAIMTLEDIQNKLAVNQLKNWQIKELNESINGVSYVGFALNAPDNINNMLLNYISYDQENNTYQVLFPKDLIDSLLNSSELQDINNSSLLSLENMGLEINLKISLPGKITETNYGNINNNEVKINLLDFITQKQTTEIKITSSKQNFDSRLINILLIIILVTSLYFLLRKKH